MNSKKVKNEVDYRGDHSLSRMREQDIRPCGDLPILRIATTLFQHTKCRYDCRASSSMLDDEQRRSVVMDEDYCLIVAGAGAEKTTTMVAKVKFLGTDDEGNGFLTLTSGELMVWDLSVKCLGTNGWAANVNDAMR